MKPRASLGAEDVQAPAAAGAAAAVENPGKASKLVAADEPETFGKKTPADAVDVKRKKRKTTPQEKKEKINPKDEGVTKPNTGMDVEDKPSQKVAKVAPMPEKSAALDENRRSVGDIWWSNMMGKACRQQEDGVDFSGPPFLQDGEVVVKFDDETCWKVPHMVPQDLEHSGLPPDVPKPQPPVPKKKAKAKAQTTKPVQDFELPTVRCKYCLQGKQSPIVKVECRVDRNDLTSKFKQRMQIVVKEGVTARAAMHVATTFAECYHHMLLNQDVINFRECRDALFGMADKGHDWDKEKLDWRWVADLTLKGFPPKCLGCLGSCIWVLGTFEQNLIGLKSSINYVAWSFDIRCRPSGVGEPSGKCDKGGQQAAPKQKGGKTKEQPSKEVAEADADVSDHDEGEEEELDDDGEDCENQEGFLAAISVHSLAV